MIFQFPDLETFRLAISSAQVPPEVSAAPAEVAFDSDGRPSVRAMAGIPPKGMQNALKKLGVKQTKDHYAAAVLAVDCWPQVLPVAKREAVPEVTANTPVLFELPAGQLPTLVTEMLRLGNDRQSFRTIAPTKGKGDRVLLKVIGPPYYTLLRAIDRIGGPGAAVTAYVEKAPKVWVELGHDHPMAGQLKPADGQVLLLRPEREWTAVEDGPFQDVYEVLDFKLPAASVEWHESQLKEKLSVPLRLVPGNAADVAEMWVLTEEAVDQLDALVRDADERLMARLSFAVAREDGQTTIVLKTRPSKLSPPVLSLAKAHGFKPYWKLPNLFLPVGRRLMPTLRRDAVRKLLADDPAQVVWLMPADGKFTPEILPDDAFRPLEDWIDYVIDHEHAALQSWVQATHFDFDGFVCRDDQGDKPKPPPGDKRRGKKGEKDDGPDELDAPVLPSKGGKKSTAAGNEADFGMTIEVASPNESKVRLRELEDRFKSVDGPLDDAERIALWPRIAHLNALLNDKSESAICWTNAFWELPNLPAEGAWGWLRTEHPDARKVPTADEWDAALGEKHPSPEAARGFAARVVYACCLNPVPESFLNRLPKVREYLERQDGVLGVRAAWLAWWHLARVGGQADVLALARVRDRLLQRLLEQGLNKERDLPYFLRTAGEQDSARMRLVRDRAVQVQKAVERWHAGEDVKVNKPYVDLLFAFGLAKLGEATAARDRVRQAGEKLLEPVGPKDRPDPAHEFLFKAFAWRIENALGGKPHAGALPADMMARLESIDADRGHTLGWSYPINRLREQSWVLEPQEKLDPYGPWKKHGNELQKTLADLFKIKEPARLEEQIKKLIKAHSAAEARLLIYAEAVPLAPRVGEEFTVKLIHQVKDVLNAVDRVTGTPEHLASLRDKQAQLLERSLFLAAHYDRSDFVKSLFDLFLDFVQSRNGIEMYDAINKVARECLRSLRKLGLRDEIDRFLRQMMDLIVQGKSLPQLKMAAGANWPVVLGALLHLAEGWLFFGGYDAAKPFLDEARDTIHDSARAGKDKGIKPQPLTKLVRTYVTALSQGPADEALDRIEKLFGILEKLPNAFTTAPYFSRLHLNIVEDVVRSLVSDNMALGEQARRWLDDDEYLVRRRIHADMRKVLSAHGL